MPVAPKFFFDIERYFYVRKVLYLGAFLYTELNRGA
jgi:hypothetical protein